MLGKKFLIVFGIVSLAVLAILFLIGLLEDDSPPLEPPAPPVKTISVYVSGQVENISVVELEDDGSLRLVDAVNAAGGLTDFADADAINLAAPLSDGQHVRIPTKDIFLLPQNISSMQVGKAEIEGRNLMVLTVDNPIPQNVLDEMKALAPIFDVTPIAYDV